MFLVCKELEDENVIVFWSKKRIKLLDDYCDIEIAPEVKKVVVLKVDYYSFVNLEENLN